MTRTILRVPGGTVARKGLRIVCANDGCRVHVATFRQELLAGAPDIGADLFDWAEGQTRGAGDGAICKKCGTPFMQDIVRASRSGRYLERVFFTSAGWIGYPLPTVKAS